MLAGLARDDLFTVVHEQVFTDTCRWADVVLPATAFLEHREIRRGYGAMRLYDVAAVATPPGEARSNNQLFGALIERMGLGREGDPVTEDEIAARHLRRRGRRRLTRAAREPTAWPSRPAIAPLLFVDIPAGTYDGKVDLVPATLDAEAAARHVPLRGRSRRHAPSRWR